jgi:hypothetical protein
MRCPWCDANAEATFHRRKEGRRLYRCKKDPLHRFVTVEIIEAARHAQPAPALASPEIEQIRESIEHWRNVMVG